MTHRKVTFDLSNKFYTTYSHEEYDRTNVFKVAYGWHNQLRLMKMEVNDYKFYEMVVAPESRKYTCFMKYNLI